MQSRLRRFGKWLVTDDRSPEEIERTEPKTSSEARWKIANILILDVGAVLVTLVVLCSDLGGVDSITRSVASNVPVVAGIAVVLSLFLLVERLRQFRRLRAAGK